MIRRVVESVETLQSETDAAYDRWAPIYDLIFDLPFHAGRLAAARAAEAATPPQGELLVVGVGTGLELELLPRRARVTGIDLSAPMLEVARRRAARRALWHVKSLLQMDAGALSFNDASFDTALAPYVLTVVPDPQRVLNEMWRVLRPGGELIVMNHFSTERGLRGAIEVAAQSPFGLARLEPDLSVLDSRRLGGNSGRRSLARAQAARAARTVYDGEDRQGRALALEVYDA